MDATDITWFCVHTAAAALMGAAIGFERQWWQHPAGIKTDGLVAFGAAFFVALPHLLGDRSAVAHVAGQVVTGIGFLAGGVILREGMNVKGMNTAATIWCSAAIGALCGAGLLMPALAGTVGVLAFHLGLRPISARLDRRLRRSPTLETMYHLRVICREGREGTMRALILRDGQSHPLMAVQGIAVENHAVPGQIVVSADIFSEQQNDAEIEALMARLNDEPDVIAVSWKRGAAP